MSVKSIIDVARGELGQTENPAGSNLTKYGFWYGVDGVPWCVIFLCWVFNEAGERMAFFGGEKTASCSILLRWYREQGLTVPVEEVQEGDIVILNFHGGKEPEHCGLVTSVLGNGLYIQTIEGNTTKGDGSQDNGGMVYEKVRYPHQVVGICRPQYQPEEPAPVDDWSNHHATDAIRWGIEMGLIQGYPDGSVRPDEPIPMWRVLTILKRYHERMEESK